MAGKKRRAEQLEEEEPHYFEEQYQEEVRNVSLPRHVVSPLEEAIVQYNLPKIQQLVSTGLSEDELNRGFLQSIRQNKTEIALYLMQNGIVFHTYSLKPIQLAIINMNLPLVQILVEHGSVLITYSTNKKEDIIYTAVSKEHNPSLFPIFIYLWNFYNQDQMMKYRHENFKDLATTIIYEGNSDYFRFFLENRIPIDYESLVILTCPDEEKIALLDHPNINRQELLEGARSSIGHIFENLAEEDQTIVCVIKTYQKYLGNESLQLLLNKNAWAGNTKFFDMIYNTMTSLNIPIELNTGLNMAVQVNDLEAVKWFVNKGANISSITQDTLREYQKRLNRGGGREEPVVLQYLQSLS